MMTCIQFRLFIKEYLTIYKKFCIDWQTAIFAEYFGANRVILRRMVALNFVQFFSGPLCSQ